MDFKRHINEAILLSLGVLCASVGLKGFLLPNGFLDGGAMGVSLLLEIITHVELSIFIVLVNLPFIIIGARQISVHFAIKSALAILLLAVCVHIIEVPVVTQDKLLIAVFGGLLLGAGIGFAIRSGAVIDGSEVLAIYLSRRTTLTVGDAITIFNVIIFAISAFFVSIETAMYSLLTYFSASKMADFLINGVEEYIGVTIISEQAAAIKDQITNHLGRGVTVYKSDSGFGTSGLNPKDRNILFCVVTRLEVSKLIAEIEIIDSKAFIVQHSIRDTKGGMIKKRPLH